MASNNKQKNLLCPRGSIGAVIMKGDEYLVLYRKTFPRGLAFIAGHTEQGEKPEDSFVREVAEESGLVVKAFDLVLHNTFPNPCKRGYDSRIAIFIINKTYIRPPNSIKVLESKHWNLIPISFRGKTILLIQIGKTFSKVFKIRG